MYEIIVCWKLKTGGGLLNKKSQIRICRREKRPKWKNKFPLVLFGSIYSSVIFSNFYISFQPYLIHRLHNSSDIIFSSTSSFSPTCRTAWTGWGERHFWKILKILSKNLTNSFKNISLVMNLKFWSFIQKAEALLRSSCNNKHANNSHILVKKSQLNLDSN